MLSVSASVTFISFHTIHNETVVLAIVLALAYIANKAEDLDNFTRINCVASV